MPRYLIITICIAAVVAFGFVFLFPQYQSLKEIRLKIETKQKELETQKEYFSNLREISEKLKEYQSEIAKINSALPEEPAIPDFLNFIQQKASENGLILKKIGSIATKPVKEKEIKETIFNLEFSGSYSALKNFLAGLEKSARFTKIESISFSFPGEKQEPFSFSLAIKAHSY